MAGQSSENYRHPYIRGGELTREAFRERLNKLKSATKALLRAGAEEKQ